MSMSLCNLALIHMPVNVIVDCAMIATTFRMYLLNDYEEDPARKWFLPVALLMGACTFTVSFAFWFLYEASRSDDYMLLLFLANAMVRTINQALMFYVYTDSTTDCCLSTIIKHIDGRLLGT